MKDKFILDACCGGRMFWFDKNNPNTLFVDKRPKESFKTGKGKHERNRSVNPDVVMDFTKLDLPDNKFSLVVFDPPHLILGANSYMAKVYGRLEDNWEETMRKGFSECFRVLKNYGVLVFKWNEFNIPLKKVLTLTPVQPLFGHVSGKAQKTHWLCFMKMKGAL